MYYFVLSVVNPFFIPSTPLHLKTEKPPPG